MTNSKVTLEDVYKVVNRLEDKMDDRLCYIEEDVDNLNAFKNSLTGKITLITGALSLVFSFIISWLRTKLKR